jgi:putative PIN family toxin of toxin-antitoxin system
VLDTSIVVAGFRSRNGASNRLLRLVALGRLRALASTALFLEYEAVVMRPEHLLASGLSMERADRLLSILAHAIHGVEIQFQWRPQLTDPDDELVLEAAINGRADAIVTHNVKDFSPAAARFAVGVLRPGELLARLR